MKMLLLITDYHNEDMVSPTRIDITGPYFFDHSGLITSDLFSKFNFIYFYPLFSRLGRKLSFIWGSYAACHGMALVSH